MLRIEPWKENKHRHIGAREMIYSDMLALTINVTERIIERIRGERLEDLPEAEELQSSEISNS